MTKILEEEEMEDLLLDAPLNTDNLSESEENFSIERDLMQDFNENLTDQLDNRDLSNKKRERGDFSSFPIDSEDNSTAKKLKISNLEENLENNLQDGFEEKDLLEISQEQANEVELTSDSERGKSKVLIPGEQDEEKKDEEENGQMEENEEEKALESDSAHQKEEEKSSELLDLNNEESPTSRWTTGSHWIEGEKLRHLNGINWKSFEEVRELLVCRRKLSQNRIEEGYSIIANLLNHRKESAESNEDGDPFIFDRIGSISKAIECDVVQEKFIRSFIQFAGSINLEECSRETKEDLFFLANNTFIEIRKGDTNNYDLMCTLISKKSDIIRVWMDLRQSEVSNGCTFVSREQDEGNDEKGSIRVLCSFGDQSSVVLFQKNGEQIQLDSSLLSRMKKETGAIDIKDEELFALLWSGCLLPSISMDHQSLASQLGWSTWPSIFDQRDSGDVNNTQEGEGDDLSFREEFDGVDSI